jgi:murein L,D-transpeptidase YafK
MSDKELIVTARKVPVTLMLLGLAMTFVVLAPASAATEELADRVVVNKSERKLFLFKSDRVLREFDIALGLVPEGPKMREGDFRTPEGNYYLTTRRANSDYFMAIQVSYPNGADIARANAEGLSAGSQIMIHGQPVVPKKSASYYKKHDWTNGCIAVSNSAMVDIWQMTTPNTPITILP